MTTTPTELWKTRDHAALVHALEIHQAELEAQNAQLQAANAALSRTNLALVIARDRFQALYEQAPTPYFTVDAELIIVDVNPAAAGMFALPRERLLGMGADQLVDDAGRGRFRAFVAAVFAAGQARCGDVILRSEAAAPVDALIDGVVLPEAAPTPARCVLAVVDITARKLAESARRRAQDEVLAIVSHDLRGPLNAISLACDGLSGGLSPDEQRECVAAIERSAARCERLIKDLLGVAHIESGRLKLQTGRFDVRDLVRQVCRDHQSAATASGATLTVSVPDPPAQIIGDRDRLHQVLSNLLRNAMVHARGAAIEVSVAWRGGHVVIAVADDGPGIPADELPLVFDRYRQGARHRGGAGLGLAIVKGLVEAHHGTATVTSQPGHGARFEVALPGAPAVDPATIAG
jgi:PAS domain S-box-containing protein